MARKKVRLMDAKDRIIQQIDAAFDADAMRDSTYRVARRLLDRAHPANGLAVLSYEDALTVCKTNSQETVRGHLARLSALGLITYRRNGQVNVFWHGWNDPPRADAATNRATAEQPPASDLFPPDTNCSQAGTDDAATDANLTESRHTRAQRADTATKRAGVEHPIAGYSKQAGINDPKPACLPRGVKGGKPKTPDDPELARCVALLCDPDGLNLDPDTARRWARGCKFVAVRAHLFRFLEERKKKPSLGVAVLETRLQRRWSATAPPWAHDHPLWNRYAVGDELHNAAPDLDTEAGRRAKYIPDEYSDIILG